MRRIAIARIWTIAVVLQSGKHPFIARHERLDMTMMAVIFEVFPADGQKGIYLDIAADLRQLLDEIDGFISIERFQSLSDPAKILSLSFWRDEQAIQTWRERLEHRDAQIRGRTGVFDDYRLRIASVVRDYGFHERAEAPQLAPELAG
jgi:heme-degrading monooxygenase HmoA